MAGPYYVDSTATGGSDTGGSWANAFLTFAQAVTAATTAGDLIYVSHAHSESLAADTTYTFGANVRVLCVNSSTGALATTALIGAQSTNYAITLAGAYVVYIYGITFKAGTSTAAKNLTLFSTDGAQAVFEQCGFTLAQTGANQSIILFGNSSNGWIDFVNCNFSFAAAGQRLDPRGIVKLLNPTFTFNATPTGLIALNGSISHMFFEGADVSGLGSANLVAYQAGQRGTFYFVNCKLHSGSLLIAPTNPINKGAADAWAYNCASGDTHYALAHYDAFGETTVSATVYANDGAAYDGTNKCSWKIVTTANCSYYTPYVSPWMDVYHSGTSAISPYLEILRSGSTTKYQNDEVWGEFSYQGTSGSTKATIVDDRMTPLGTAADQTASSLDASGWTGEDATNNAYMKLEAGSITPAEIGHIRARVCVGEPSITVYVDPKIRGLS